MSQSTPEVEAVQTLDVAAQFEETVLQNIDLERFEAVPEHDGSVQRLIERYGDNPSTCPYIKSMGAAGIELVQKLAASESNPERGPTMRELMEAKKKQAQISETASENSKPTKEINTLVAKIAERKADTKPGVIEPKVTAAERLIAQEHAKRVIDEALRTADSITTKKATIVVTAPVNPVKQHQQNNVRPRAEKTMTAQTAVSIEQVTIIDAVEDAQLHNIDTVEFVQLPITNVPEPLGDPLERDSTIQIPASAELSEVVEGEQIVVEAMMGEQEIGTESDAMLMSVEDEEFDFESLLAELGLHGFLPEVANDMQIAEEPAEITFKELGEDAGLVLTDINPGLVIETPSVLTVSGEALIDAAAPQENVTPVELEEELSAYIQLLEPNKAETAQATLDELVKAIQNIQEQAESSADEKIVTKEEVEQLFTQLLESMGLNCSEETAKKIMRALVTPEVLEDLAEEEQLTIHLLNYLGTREYRSNSIISLFTSLLQMIKDKVEPHLRIGKYALSTSFAYEPVMALKA